MLTLFHITKAFFLAFEEVQSLVYHPMATSGTETNIHGDGGQIRGEEMQIQQPCATLRTQTPGPSERPTPTTLTSEM